MKLFATAVVFLGALSVFIWMGIIEGSVPVIGIAEAKAHEGDCRIDDGVIQSIESLGSPLAFTVRSKKSPDLILPVQSPRSPPDNFKVGNEVSIKGTFDPTSGIFTAVEVLTACPSKYQASKAGTPEYAPPPAPPTTANRPR